MQDYETAYELENGLRGVLAPNPSPLTFRGTNTYILGASSVVVVDPGPDIDSHLDAILGAIRGAKLEAILVTHSHLDHSPLCAKLKAQTGAPVLGYGPSDAGQSDQMAELAKSGDVGGGEGIDEGFKPDITLSDGETIDVEGAELQALWTPGHLSNHLSFALGDAVLTGDHVMGWATSLISPPDGDLTAFMNSCRKLEARQDRVYYPGHGDPVTDPAERIAWLIDHRLGREAQILHALDRPGTAAEITGWVYTDIEPYLLPAAERNVLAHLIDLVERGIVFTDGPLSLTSKFHLNPER